MNGGRAVAVSDGAAVLLSMAAVVGAAAARPVPPAVVLAAAGLAVVGRRPVLLAAALALGTSGLGARAYDGLAHPPAAVRGWTTLVGDPVTVAGGGVRVHVRVGRHRLEATAPPTAAGALRGRLAGEQVELSGPVRRVDLDKAPWLAARHVGGRLAVSAVGRWRPGSSLSRVANGLRRTLARGAAHLPAEPRSLLLGVVVGDDRDQPPALQADFRVAGLSHLLAVSGQNIAFVLLVCAPALRLLPLGHRTAAAMAVLVVFGTVTRWEPSVIRAVAMAAVGLVATWQGRPVATVRTLALAVTTLVLVDPLLVRSVGFLLSVGACAGIATLAGPLAARLPGPRPLALPAAVTVAAQLGVGPVLVPAFGGVPVAALPANLLAAVAAGPAMVWGLIGGLAAGVAGEPLATVIHVPSRLLLGWIAAVARGAAALPLGDLRAPHLVALGGIGMVVAARPGWSRAGLLGAVAVVLAPAAGLAFAGDVDGRALAVHSRLWRGGGAVVLEVGGDDPVALLTAAREHGLRRIDFAFARGRAAGPALAVLGSRIPISVVAAPEGAVVAADVRLGAGQRLRAGGLSFELEVDGRQARLRRLE